MTMTDLCAELKNYFNRGMPVWFGEFHIVNGVLESDKISLLPGQYYRIIGSVFNDGVHSFQTEELTDESFSGAVWAMAVPPAVIALVREINDWIDKYEAETMKPFSSETISGVYSYTKAGGGSGEGGGSAGPTWQSMFSQRLNKWRKI